MAIQFSLIIPVYNTQFFIEKCLKSIQLQTFEQYEVIIIDDGSTDDSIDLCYKYLKNIKNMIIIHQENRGLSSARNRALKIAKGKYIWFIDSDDYINDCDTLEIIYNELEENFLDILQFNARFKVHALNQWSLEKNNKKIISNFKDTAVLSGKDYLRLIAQKDEWRYGVWTFVFRREFLINNNIYFHETFIHEDAAFNVNVLSVCQRIKFINNVLYVYRIRPLSIMSKETTIANVKGYLQAYRSIDKVLEEEDNLRKFFLNSIFLQIVERVFYLRNSTLDLYKKELLVLGENHQDYFNSANLIKEALSTSEKDYHIFLDKYSHKKNVVTHF